MAEKTMSTLETGAVDLAQETAEELFSPVNTGRTSSHIVNQILALVHERRLKVGDQLPPERTLCNLLSASRPSVREALRVLESRGLLRIQVGARGGAFITVPSSDKAGQGFVDLMRISRPSVAAVTEARTVLELGVLPLACERATSDDIKDLRKIVSVERTGRELGTYELGETINFHVRLIRCAGNDVINLLEATLHDAVLESIKITQSDPHTNRRRGMNEHKQIIDAVERRDPEAAVRIMRTHLGRTAKRGKGR